MKVFKFGGASVKNAEAVKNVASILNLFQNEKLLVVISAMGKTTNALENYNRSLYYKQNDSKNILSEITSFHKEIIEELGLLKNNNFPETIESIFKDLESFSISNGKFSFDHMYDQIVSKGEMLSTQIVNLYLNKINMNSSWLDVRECIYTDHTHREGNVDWELTTEKTRLVIPQLFQHNDVIITQGFIGNSSEDFTTTLGREGSDYSASILAHCLDADNLTIWKDVPGVLNADPKWFDNTVKLDKLSYQDAIELAYYGASVIHPKTIQPLKHKEIKLHVKSFLNPKEDGTIVGEKSYDSLVPSFIFKMDQVIISIGSRDFSFIAEDYLHTIFGIFAKNGLKINLMQNSAISFLVCINNDPEKINAVVKELNNHNFKIELDQNLELITIRYYDSATIERVCKNKDIVLQQKGKRTIQLVVKDLGKGITI